MKTIFIAGLPRSGSTALCLLIGSHPDCVAVGEVANVIKADSKEYALKKLSEHPSQFWSEVLHLVDGVDGLEYRYAIFLNVFSEFFPGKVPVDSSKGSRYVPILSRLSDCRVIFCIRDARGWCTSCQKKISAAGLLRWYFRNRREDIKNALHISYEGLCVDPDGTMGNVFRFSGLTGHHATMTKKHHILAGNRMKSNPGAICYDEKWKSKKSLAPYILWPVMRYNRRMVYSKRKIMVRSHHLFS